jgi:hypothetical protein
MLSRLIAVVVSVFLMMGLLLVQGCKKDNDKTPDNTQSVIKDISTVQGGVLELEGISLVVSPQTVPRLANGENATVNFSLEVGVELPKAFPSNMKLVGKTSHFGPEGFIFAEPMFLLFKLPNGVTFDQVSIIGYDNASGKYGVYPITYYDEDRQEVGTNVYELGYYMLANVSELNRTRAPFGSGAFRINIFNNKEWYPQRGGRNDWANDRTYQKLIITNFVPTYPEEMALWAPYDPNSNGGQRYWEALTPPQAGGWHPNHVQGITFRGPQGTYTAQLVNSHKFLMFDWPECRQYSLPFTFTIGAPVTCSSANNCTGWSDAPVMPGGGSWEPIPCFGEGSYKPVATTPVCTGDFQATLTWFNGSGSSGETDLDLHLYGPNNIHVYYGNKNPGCPCGLMLDRDMISETGWVQENICANSLAGMPRGDYRIEVDLFSGQDKDFQVRVLRGAQSNSYSGRVTGANATKTILEFKL